MPPRADLGVDPGAHGPVADPDDHIAVEVSQLLEVSEEAVAAPAQQRLLGGGLRDQADDSPGILRCVDRLYDVENLSGHPAGADHHKVPHRWLSRADVTRGSGDRSGVAPPVAQGTEVVLQAQPAGRLAQEPTHAVAHLDG